MSSENPDQQDLSYVVEGKAVQAIREHGPQSTDELVTLLQSKGWVYCSVAGLEYPFPDGELEWMLEESDRVVRDDSDRWHLTAEA